MGSAPSSGDLERGVQEEGDFDRVGAYGELGRKGLLSVQKMNKSFILMSKTL